MSVKRCLYGPLRRHKLQASYEAVVQATLNKKRIRCHTNHMVWKNGYMIYVVYMNVYICIHAYVETCFTLNSHCIKWIQTESQLAGCLRGFQTPPDLLHCLCTGGKIQKKTPIDNRCNKRFLRTTFP